MSQMHNNDNIEENEMTNNQTVAFIEALKIIVEKATTKEEIKDALVRIQDAVKNTTR